jgi:hypothetical protein
MHAAHVELSQTKNPNTCLAWIFILKNKKKRKRKLNGILEKAN